MRVWRVGHSSALRDGFPQGPYTYGPEMSKFAEDLADGMCWAHSNNDHPSPFRDGHLYDIYSYEVCGLPSRADLDRWFEPHWRARLHRAGYLVHVYEAPDTDVRLGDIQLVFKRSSASLVRSEPLVSACDLVHVGEEEELCLSKLPEAVHDL